MYVFDSIESLISSLYKQTNTTKKTGSKTMHNSKKSNPTHYKLKGVKGKKNTKHQAHISREAELQVLVWVPWCEYFQEIMKTTHVIECHHQPSRASLTLDLPPPPPGIVTCLATFSSTPRTDLPGTGIILKPLST